MSRILSLAIALIALPLFADSAFNHKGTRNYTGGGEWKTTCGGKGTFTTQVKFHDNEMAATVKMGNEAFSYKLNAIWGKNQFFQLTPCKECSAVIGGGYCYGTRCHYGIKSKDGLVEETFHFREDGSIKVVGSKFTTACDEKNKDCCTYVAWKTKLVKAR